MRRHRQPSVERTKTLGSVCAALLLTIAVDVRASEPNGPPHPLSLEESVRLTRAHGYDLALASAQVRGAEADVRAAGATPNPLLNGNLGWTLSCASGGASCSKGSPWGWGVGVSDQGLLEGAITRKRALRQTVAERALDVAKLGRLDAERVLVAATKIQYVQTATAALKLEFTREVAASLAKSVEVNRVRYPRVIDEGQLFRVEQEALKADQEVDRAKRDLRQQQVELAYLVGITGEVPDIVVDKDAIKFRVPDSLASVGKDALFKLALANRPDRRQASAREAQSEAQIASARRARIPDVSFNAQYSQQGTFSYSSQLPTLTVGAILPIPLFYQLDGEIRRAEADREAAAVARSRIDATLAGDIESAYNAFETARAIVTRYEGGLLDKARRARDIIEVQFKAGSATLTDLLDAQRSFVQVNLDYEIELLNYWTAVFTVEQAVGKEIVP